MNGENGVPETPEWMPESRPWPPVPVVEPGLVERLAAIPCCDSCAEDDEHIIRGTN